MELTKEPKFLLLIGKSDIGKTFAIKQFARTLLKTRQPFVSINLKEELSDLSTLKSQLQL